MFVQAVCLFVFLTGILVEGLNITIQGSSQYVVPERPFTFTCVFNPGTKEPKVLLQNEGNFEAVQLSNDGSGVCYNVTSAATVCDPSRCSCSKEGDIFTANWTLLSIDTEYTWMCREINNRSLPLSVKIAVQVTSVTLEKVTGSQIDVVAGQNISLTCVTGQSRPRSFIQWYIGNDNYTMYSTPAVTNGYNELTSVTSVMTFTVRRELADLVVNCKAYNIDPSTTVELVNKPKLNVQYPPPSKAASIIDTGDSLSVKETTIVTLQCEVVGGNPLAVINWRCFNGTVSNASKSGTARSNVTFTASSSFNGKLCVCSATHPASVIQNDSVHINVTYRPKFISLQPKDTYYIVNETGSLSPIICSADCNPGCSYTWTGPGLSTITGTTLHITDVKKEQAGNYLCTAINTLGRNTSENVVIEVNYKPKYVSLQPQKLFYTVNESQTLDPIQCSADCNPNCSFLWTGPESFTLSGPQLHINSITKIQAGNYTCTARNIVGSKTSEIVVIIVTYRPKVITFNPPNVSYTLIEGTPLGPIQCNTDCFPECTYTWNGPITISGSNLTIAEIGRKQEGYYRCTAINSVGSLSSSEINVTVNYGPGDSLILDPPSLYYEVNETYRLAPINCRATCKPSCAYKWIIPGQNDILGNNLTILNINRSDAGLYRCIAYNGINNGASKIINITVHYAAKVKSLNISRNNFTISEHSTPKITCHAEGLPLPQITLRYVRNNTIISNATGVDLQYRFSAARCEDTGEYKCEAVNKFNPKSPIKKDIFVLCYPRPINITNKDRQVAYGSGETLNIATMYLAYPKPTFKWYFKLPTMSNLSKLTNGSENVQINNIFEYHSEVFRHVSLITRYSLQEEYFGSYLIHASNEVNVTTDKFFVAAQGHPNRPSKVEAICLDYQSANITWVSEFNNGDPQRFSVHYEMSNKTFVSSEIKDPGLKERITLGITKLTESSTYNFTVVARNKFGETKSLFVNCTTVKKENPDDNDMSGLAFGLGFGSAAVIIIMVIIVIFLVRRITSSPSKARDTEMNGKSSLTSRQYNENDEDEMRINELYVSAGPNYVKPGSSGEAVGENKPSSSGKKSNGLKLDSEKESAVYAVVQKQKKEEQKQLEDNSLIYSVVNKTKTGGTGGDTEKKHFNKRKAKAKDGQARRNNRSGDAQVYENVSDMNFASNTNQSEIKKRQKKKAPKTSGKKNQDELIYLELDLQDPDKDGSRFVIRGIENKTDYADVDFTKRAEPLPPESEENMPET